jgi:hypothetical protein
MNYVDALIRDFARILNADRSPATGIAASITVRLYNPLLVLIDTANPIEFTLGEYYYDFTPGAAGTWLVLWDCATLEIHAAKVYDVIEDIVAQLKQYTAQAF